MAEMSRAGLTCKVLDSEEMLTQRMKIKEVVIESETQGDFGIKGNATISGTIQIKKDAAIEGNAEVSGGIVGGSLKGGSLDVVGGSELRGGAIVTGNVQATGNVNASGGMSAPTASFDQDITTRRLKHPDNVQILTDGLEIDFVGLMNRGKGHTLKDHEIDDPTQGIVLRGPSGGRFRIRVDDMGNLFTENLDA